VIIERKALRTLEAYYALFPDTVEAHEILQLSAGRFDFSMQIIDLGDVKLEWNRLDSRCRIRERYVGDGLVIGIPIEQAGAVHLQGNPVPRGSTVVWSCGRELDYTTLPGTAGLVITLSGSLVARLNIVSPTSPTLPLTGSRRILEVCRSVSATLGAAARTHGQTLEVRRMTARDQVLSVLRPALDRFEDAWQVTEGRHHARHWPLIRRAEALMRDHGHAVSIDDLTEQLEVPRRTLFHAFRKTLGVGPHQFDRVIRLHRLRSALLASAPESTFVTHLAITHGFTHLGRLSADYREFFGESPRDTLSRSG